MYRAMKVITGGDSFIGTTERFIVEALRWLGMELGDVHLQMTKGDGWQVSTCYKDDDWEGWDDLLCGKTMQDALAKAVIAVAKNRGGL